MSNTVNKNNLVSDDGISCSVCKYLCFDSDNSKYDCNACTFEEDYHGMGSYGHHDKYGFEEEYDEKESDYCFDEHGPDLDGEPDVRPDNNIDQDVDEEYSSGLQSYYE